MADASKSAAFDPAAVSSLVEVLADENGALTVAPPPYLPLWLPHLEVPAGWIEGTSEATAPVTRMLVRRIGDAGPADGCELLNLYGVPGRIAESTVLDNADRTLRDCGAKDTHTWRVELPEGHGAVGMRSVGRLVESARDVWAQYSYYAINTADAGAALIEQTIVIGYDALPALVAEMNALTADVLKSLAASLSTAPRASDADNPLSAASGRPLTWSDPGSIAVQTTSGQRRAAGAEPPATDHPNATRARHEAT